MNGVSAILGTDMVVLHFCVVIGVPLAPLLGMMPNNCSMEKLGAVLVALAIGFGRVHTGVLCLLVCIGLGLSILLGGASIRGISNWHDLKQ